MGGKDVSYCIIWRQGIYWSRSFNYSRFIKNEGIFKIKLINIGSEEYNGEEDDIDFAASSPPYYNQEIYSDDIGQAYNKGEDYFYNIYWTKTLKNIKRMLKPGKWFGLNVINYSKMVDMAREEFGTEEEVVKLRTTRNHLTKMAGVTKFEPIYMFKKT